MFCFDVVLAISSELQNFFFTAMCWKFPYFKIIIISILNFISVISILSFISVTKYWRSVPLESSVATDPEAGIWMCFLHPRHLFFFLKFLLRMSTLQPWGMDAVCLLSLFLSFSWGGGWGQYQTHTHIHNKKKLPLTPHKTSRGGGGLGGGPLSLSLPPKKIDTSDNKFTASRATNSQIHNESSLTQHQA